MPESPDPTPEQDAVRRLLADARHDAPTPPAVVSRLEDALVSLQAERADTSGAAAPTTARTAPVIDLASRRRRLVGIGVMAAAAVVVAGVAVGQVLPQGSSDSGETSAASSADDSAMDSQAGGPAGGDDPAAESTVPDELAGKAAASPALPEVGLDDDLDSTLTALRSASRRASPLADSTLVPCQVGDVGPGRQVLVQVDGQPGLVVFRAARGSSQEADLYLCGDPDAVRRLSLPAP